MAIYPSGKSVTVCNGSSLELRCRTDGRYLEWSFTRAATQPISRLLSIYSAQSYLLVNSTTFNFSRVTARGSLPLESRVLIAPAYFDLNETHVNCMDLATLNSSSTLVYVVSEPAMGDLSREFVVFSHEGLIH